jgi:hypothetical protein
MQNAHDVSTATDPNLNLIVAKVLGDKELNVIKCYHAIVRSLRYAALETQPNV